MTTATDLTEIIVEWVAGEAQRYEWDETTDALVPVEDERARIPPEHYGCVPGTRAADGEPLDVLLLRDSAGRTPGDRVRVRVVGVLRRSDGDHKLLAVDPDNYVATDITAVDPDRLVMMWRWFWRRHVLLGWFGPDDARAILADAQRRWAARG